MYKPFTVRLAVRSLVLDDHRKAKSNKYVVPKTLLNIAAMKDKLVYFHACLALLQAQ